MVGKILIYDLTFILICREKGLVPFVLFIRQDSALNRKNLKGKRVRLYLPWIIRKLSLMTTKLTEKLNL